MSYDSLVSIPKEYIDKLNYMVNSVDVPLAVLMVIATFDAAIDSIGRSTISPSIIGPFLGAVFYACCCYFPDRWVNVLTRQGQRFHINATRCLGLLPCIGTVVMLHIEDPPSFHGVAACTRLMPPFLGGIVARNHVEAIAFLSVHVVLVAFSKIPDYWSNIFFLFLLDAIVVVVAWLKGQLIWIVDQMVHVQVRLAQSLSESEKSLDSVQKSLRVATQRESRANLELERTRELVVAQGKELVATETQLSSAAEECSKVRSQYEEMTRMAQTAIQLAVQAKDSAASHND